METGRDQKSEKDLQSGSDNKPGHDLQPGSDDKVENAPQSRSVNEPETDQQSGSDKNGSAPVMIRIDGLRKRYRLGRIGAGTLQGTLKELRERRRDPVKAKKFREERNKTFYALNGIDVTVHKGETLGIIGRNGAGKSTLLKILSRITASTEGTVDLYGRVTSMLEVGTGFHGEMTGRENIYLNGAILGMKKSEIDAKMDDIIRFAELEEFIDTPIKRYSSGMFVKLGFSVAFHLDSEIIIMDEVLAVGDIAFQQKCIKCLMKAARDDDRTVLYVSHNMNTVRQLCDRCIVLDKGKVVFDGETDKAIAVYLGAQELMASEIVYGPEHRPDDYIIRKHKRFSMNSLRLVDRPDPVFYCNDTAVLEMSCTAEEPLKNLGLRFEFWYQDGTKVATSLSGNFVSFEPGDSVIRIRLPLRHLVSGQYRADIVAFLFDGSGNENKIDAVYPGFTFLIESVMDSENYLEWNHKFWGMVRLDDIELSDCAIASTSHID